jgi:hypothetical protein
MTACLLRPVSGAGAASPRIELLDLDGDDIESGFARRFLEACGVPAAELALAVDEARATADADGRPLLEVTVAEGTGHARVRALAGRSVGDHEA